MRQPRRDYTERIQDTAGLIPDDEPVFLIRAVDPVGAATVEAWADLAEAIGTEPRLVHAVREWVVQMETYRAGLIASGAALKDVPDAPAGVLHTES